MSGGELGASDEPVEVVIVLAGDRSAGMPSMRWHVTGGIKLASAQDREYVREALESCWMDIIETPVSVHFSDEPEAS